MKRLFYFLLGALLMTTGVAFAAPVAQNFTNIQPFITDTYDNGTSSLEWLHVFTKNASTTNLSIAGITNCNTTSALTTNGTGAVACGSITGGGGSSTFGTTSISATYPIIWNTSTANISTAFGTTTSNTFAGTQTFTNSPVFSTLGAGTVNSTSGGTIYNTGTSTPTVTAPITYSGTLGQFINGVSGAFGCLVASGSQPGCLSSTDWNTFNNKQPAGSYLTAAITALGPTGQTQTGATQTLATSTTGSDFTVTATGNVQTFNLPFASASNNGKLSSTDWSTFNGKQASGSYLTALTGDVTASGPGSAATTLATVNGNVGSFTNANITVNAKGLITAASNGSGGGGSTFGQTVAIDGSNWISATTTGTYGINANAQGTTYGYGIGDALLGYASSTNQDTIWGLKAGGNNATTSSTAKDIVAIGFQALNANTTGGGNMAVGALTLSANVTGSDNSAIGFDALQAVQGSNNTGIGTNAGSNLTGSSNIIIGAGVFGPIAAGTGQLNIGNLIYGTNAYGNGGSSSFVPTGGFIAIGTTTPYSTLEVWGPDTNVGKVAFAVVNNASTTEMSVDDAGNAIHGGTITVGNNGAGSQGTSTINGSVLIASSSPSALSIQNGSGATVVNVNTNPAANAPIFQVQATSTTDTLFQVDQYGHLTASSTPKTPTVSTCGTGTGTLSGNSNDVTGVVTTATAATACTITFGSPYSSTPNVLVTGASLVGFPAVTAVSTTAFTIGVSAAVTGDAITYMVVMP